MAGSTVEAIIMVAELNLLLKDYTAEDNGKWYPSTAQHDRHDIRSSPGTGEVQRAKPRSVHGVCRPELSTQSAEMVYDRYYVRLAALTCLSTSYEGMVARVQDQGQTSEPFSVTNGTKQGCVMAPLLFTLVCSASMMRSTTTS